MIGNKVNNKIEVPKKEAERKSKRRKITCNRIHLDSSMEKSKLKDNINDFIESMEEKYSSFKVISIQYSTEQRRRYSSLNCNYEHDTEFSVCIHYSYTRTVKVDGDEEDDSES